MVLSRHLPACAVALVSAAGESRTAVMPCRQVIVMFLRCSGIIGADGGDDGDVHDTTRWAPCSGREPCSQGWREQSTVHGGDPASCILKFFFLPSTAYRAVPKAGGGRQMKQEKGRGEGSLRTPRV